MNRDSKKRNCDCGGELTEEKLSKVIPLAGRRIRVRDVPGSKCLNCGEIFFDGPTLLKLETQLLKEATVV